MASEFTPLTEDERDTAANFYEASTVNPTVTERFPRRLWEHIQVLNQRNTNLSEQYRIVAKELEALTTWAEKSARPLITTMVRGTRIVTEALDDIAKLHVPSPTGDPAYCQICKVAFPCPTRQVIIDSSHELAAPAEDLHKLMEDGAE